MLSAEFTGIPCPQCGSLEDRVLECRPGKGYLRRRRRCLSCGHRWSTIEQQAEFERGHKPTIDEFKKLAVESAVLDKMPEFSQDWGIETQILWLSCVEKLAQLELTIRQGSPLETASETIAEVDRVNQLL